MFRGLWNWCRKSTLIRLIGDFSPNKTTFYISGILMVVNMGIDLISPFLLYYGAERYDPNADELPEESQLYLMGFALSRVGSQLICDYRFYLITAYATQIAQNLTERLKNRFLLISHHDRAQLARTENIAQRISSAQKGIIDYMDELFCSFPSVVNVTVNVGIIIYQYRDWYIGTITVGAVALPMSFIMLTKDTVERTQKESEDAESSASSSIQEETMNFNTIKCFSPTKIAFGNEVKDSNRELENSTHIKIRSERKAWSVYGAQNFFTNGGRFAIVAYLYYRIQRNHWQLKDLLYILSFYNPIVENIHFTAHSWKNIAKSSTKVEKALDIIDHYNPEYEFQENGKRKLEDEQQRFFLRKAPKITFHEVIVDRKKVKTAPEIPKDSAHQRIINTKESSGELRVPLIHNVDKSEEDVEDENSQKKKQHGLKNINFTLEPNTVVALVGPSGAGKSTITELLLQQIIQEDWWGDIKIDGKDIKKFPKEILRQNIAIVSQNTDLFNNRSLFKNVEMGNYNASPEEIEAAIRDVGLSSKNPNETVAGFSGGERQRVCFARALLKKAPIYIFDEPTSALDNETQATLVQQIFALKKKATILIITHRLDFMPQVDRIIYLSKREENNQTWGYIANPKTDIGTHQHLMAYCENYKRLYEERGSENKELHIVTSESDHQQMFGPSDPSPTSAWKEVFCDLSYVGDEALLRRFGIHDRSEMVTWFLEELVGNYLKFEDFSKDIKEFLLKNPNSKVHTSYSKKLFTRLSEPKNESESDREIELFFGRKQISKSKKFIEIKSHREQILKNYITFGLAEQAPISYQVVSKIDKALLRRVDFYDRNEIVKLFLEELESHDLQFEDFSRDIEELLLKNPDSKVHTSYSRKLFTGLNESKNEREVFFCTKQILTSQKSLELKSLRKQILRNYIIFGLAEQAPISHQVVSKIAEMKKKYRLYIFQKVDGDGNSNELEFRHKDHGNRKNKNDIFLLYNEQEHTWRSLKSLKSIVLPYFAILPKAQSEEIIYFHPEKEIIEQVDILSRLNITRETIKKMFHDALDRNTIKIGDFEDEIRELLSDLTSEVHTHYTKTMFVGERVRAQSHQDKGDQQASETFRRILTFMFKGEKGLELFELRKITKYRGLDAELKKHAEELFNSYIENGLGRTAPLTPTVICKVLELWTPHSNYFIFVRNNTLELRITLSQSFVRGFDDNLYLLYNSEDKSYRALIMYIKKPKIRSELLLAMTEFSEVIPKSNLYLHVIGRLTKNRLEAFKKDSSIFVQSEERQIILLFEIFRLKLKYEIKTSIDNPALNALEFEGEQVVVLPEIQLSDNDAASTSSQMKAVLEHYKSKRSIYLCIHCHHGNHYTTLVISKTQDGGVQYRYIDSLYDNDGNWIGLEQEEGDKLRNTLIGIFPTIAVMPNISYKRQQFYQNDHNNECAFHTVFDTLFMLFKGIDANLGKMRQFIKMVGENPSGNGGLDPKDAAQLRPLYCRLFDTVLEASEQLSHSTISRISTSFDNESKHSGTDAPTDTFTPSYRSKKPAEKTGKPNVGPIVPSVKPESP